MSLCGIKTPDYKLVQNANEAADFIAKASKDPSEKFVAKIVSPDVRSVVVGNP